MLAVAIEYVDFVGGRVGDLEFTVLVVRWQIVLQCQDVQ